MVSTRRSGSLSGDKPTTANGSSKRTPSCSEEKTPSPKRQKVSDQRPLLYPFRAIWRFLFQFWGFTSGDVKLEASPPVAQGLNSELLLLDISYENLPTLIFCFDVFSRLSTGFGREASHFLFWIE